MLTCFVHIHAILLFFVLVDKIQKVDLFYYLYHGMFLSYSIEPIPSNFVVRSHTPWDVQDNLEIEAMLDRCLHTIMQNHVVRMNEKKKKFGEYLLHNFPNIENDMFLTNAHNGTMIMIDEATLQLRSKSGKILQDAIIAVSKDVEMMTEKITE